MNTQRMPTLKSTIVGAFLLLILVIGLMIGVLGYCVIANDVVARQQQTLRDNLDSARLIYDSRIKQIEQAFSLLSPSWDFGAAQDKMGLDYLRVVALAQQETVRSEIARQALNGVGLGGTRIISQEELTSLAPAALPRAQIEIRPTPQARPTDRKILTDALAIEYAMPLRDSKGYVTAVVYGGKIINRDPDMVDMIRRMVFENRLFGNKSVGTVTIFQDDVRVATNVLTSQGERAIGTQVSARVYDTVFHKRQLWLNRAFVVNDWYLTAYEPLMDINGNIIGMLYVGMLEAPFHQLRRNILLTFLLIILASAVLAVLLSLVLARLVTRPMNNVLQAIDAIAGGKLHHRVGRSRQIQELHALEEAFDAMATQLAGRDQSLRVFNEKLVDLNKNYIDLVGFVSHELKGILASTILNAHMVRDGFLGMINFKQRKALDSVARNLDYLDATVKNFLSLSRLEQGELPMHKRPVLGRDDLAAPALESFIRQAEEKEMTVVNAVPRELTLDADPDLLLVALNNLVSNAVKYGRAGGQVVVSGRIEGQTTALEVYNDGRPLSGPDQELLFKKFSRIRTPETKAVKGTGLGLYITRQIVEQHDGRIDVEARPNGNAFIIRIEGRTTEHGDTTTDHQKEAGPGN